MRKILGAKIGIYLKGADNTFANLSGVLVHTDEKHIYLQKTSDKTLVIPRDNVLYYESDRVPLNEDDSLMINHDVVSQDTKSLQSKNILNILINGELVSSITCSPEFQLSAWHNGIMEMILGDVEVQKILSNMTQEKVEFDPVSDGANVYITATHIPQQPSDGNSFAMSGSGSNIATSYVSPAEMATRLNNVAQRGKKNE